MNETETLLLEKKSQKIERNEHDKFVNFHLLINE